MSDIRLSVRNLVSGYVKKQVISNVSLDVSDGSITGIIGPNGSGKSTVLKSICGLIPSWRGSIQLDTISIDKLTPRQIVSHGISFVPQGGRVFADLSVIENLEIGGFYLSRNKLRQGIEDITNTFPLFKSRLKQRADTLSGGEQQMLALARAMISTPKMMILDEPTIGLSPLMVNKILGLIMEISRSKKIPFLIVEQRVRDILSICDKVYGIKLGRIVFQGDPSELQQNQKKLKDIFL